MSTSASAAASAELPPTIPPLQIYPTVSSLRAWRRPLLLSKSVGFVPTMGALHDGHLSLIRRAASENDAVAVSIFVNPAQFSPSEDLSVYPRTLPSDLAHLHALNETFAEENVRGRVEAVFLPPVDEIYPSGIPLEETAQRGAFVSVQPLGSKLEGVTRPHFFRGVATVCSKLYNIVQPDTAYFGQKDVQQCVVLKRLVKDLCFPVEMHICPTGREEDGLAMSSRNVYLGPKRREVAPVLYKALLKAEDVWNSGVSSVKEMKEAGKKVLDETLSKAGVQTELEYFSVADPEELEELDEVQAEKGAIVSAALKMLPTHDGERAVRIIDNVILQPRV